MLFTEVNFSEGALAKNCNELSMPIAIYIVVQLQMLETIFESVLKMA